MKWFILAICFMVNTALFAVYEVQAADKTPEQFVVDARELIKVIDVGEVKRIVDGKQGIIIVDVRDRHEFEEGHIPGAINISRGTLEFKAATMIPDKSARIVVYCGVDLRSPLATRVMTELGYKNVVNMTGGLKAWKEAGYPTVK